MNKQKIANVAFFCIVLALVLVMIYSGLRILESTVFHPVRDDGQDTATKTVIRDGVEYFPRQDITVLMVLGIDKYGPVESSGSYNNSGDADMVMLLIFDESDQTCDVLYLNRDTMVEMPILGFGGRPAGTQYAQLTLSHTFGSGMEDSCENVKKTLEGFLHGLHIDYYVSFHMDSILQINDAVGGVTVNVVDDFTDVDPTITKGEYTLMGQQAITYVQTRKDVGDQLNVTRMERQKEYLTNLLQKFREKGSSDASFALKLFDSISPYIVTDCSGNVMTSLLNHYSDYKLGEFVTLEGNNVRGEKYYEFYADEAALDALVIRLFYAKKK